MGFTYSDLAHGGREVGLPVNTCSQVIGLTAGFHAAGEGLAYFFHRTKLHKLERFPRWYLIESSAYCGRTARFTDRHAKNLESWQPDSALLSGWRISTETRTLPRRIS